MVREVLSKAFWAVRSGILGPRSGEAATYARTDLKLPQMQPARSYGLEMATECKNGMQKRPALVNTTWSRGSESGDRCLESGDQIIGVTYTKFSAKPEGWVVRVQ